MSQWDKLLARICALSKDLRFDELRKVLESYGYQMTAPGAGAATIPSAKQAVCPLRYPSTNRSKKYMWNGASDRRE